MRIRITRIEVAGTTELGEFSGVLQIPPGLQVVSGQNRYGKSLAFAAITWCLGVEQIYGVQTNDNSIFPDAARLRLDLGDARGIRVTSSEARIQLERSDGGKLSLVRSIVGGDPAHIAFDDGAMKGILHVGKGASTDGTGGFQAHFRDWARLPEFLLMNNRGAEYPIYLENLAALFLIEQLRGWTNIQAEQVYRYGLQEVADGAFEYLLGLDRELQNRLVRQRAVSQEQALRESARLIVDEFRKFMLEQGWQSELSARGSPRDVAGQWAKLDLRTYVKETFQFDAQGEQRRLAERLVALRKRLQAPDGRPTRVSSAASQNAIQLKHQRHELQNRIRTLRSQATEQHTVLISVDERLSSARALLRLKTTGVGILPIAECPTCGQAVNPERLHLHDQGSETVALHVATLERQRSMLRSNAELVGGELVAAIADARRLEEETQQAESAVSFVNDAAGPAREAAVQLATDILGVEREIARTRAISDRLDSFQEQLIAWIGRARNLVVPEEVPSDEVERRRLFTMSLKENVVALGVGGVTRADAAGLHLGDHYEPRLGDRGLPAYGSASDRARLVLAYVLALLSSGDRHIGFVVLDEPVQQNPDTQHKTLWLDFLATFGQRQEAGHTLVFTSLSNNEVLKLRAAGVPVQERTGHFLAPVPPAAPEDEPPQAPPAPPSTPVAGAADTAISPNGRVTEPSAKAG